MIPLELSQDLLCLILKFVLKPTLSDTPPSFLLVSHLHGVLLSSRDGYPLEPKSGLNGVKPPVEFGERTRDCSLGHAGKEGPHLEMTGASRGFSQGAVPAWGFSRDRMGS